MPQNIEDMFGSTRDSRPAAPAPMTRSRLNQALANNQTEETHHNFRLGIILVATFFLVVLLVSVVYIIRGRENKNNGDTAANNCESFFERLLGGNDEDVLAGDTDRDGLSDEQERELKTDPVKVDTDGDTLTDREEALVYKTDPLNNDSDNDGMKDGEEIQNRRDPKNNNPNAEWPPKPTAFN